MYAMFVLKKLSAKEERICKHVKKNETYDSGNNRTEHNRAHCDVFISGSTEKKEELHKATTTTTVCNQHFEIHLKRR